MLLRVFWALLTVGLLIPARLLLPGASAATGEPETKVTKQKSSSKAAKEVAALVAKSQKSWNKGDLDAFLEDYSRSKEVTYVSNGTVKRGFDAIRDYLILHYRMVKPHGNASSDVYSYRQSNLGTKDKFFKRTLHRRPSFLYFAASQSSLWQASW